MGEVIIVLKVLPDDPASFAKVKKELEKLKPKRLEEEPIAFGLKALKFTTIIPDEGGKQDELEEKVRSIKGVGDVEVTHVSRCL